MNAWLFKLLGVRADDSGAVVGATVETNPALGWAWIVALAALATVVAVLSYRRRDVDLTPGRRRVLLVLRVLALLGLVTVLLRPGLSLSVEGLVRQGVLLLFDQSASMALRDPRTESADQAREAIATGRLPATAGLSPSPPAPGPLRPTRTDLLRAILTNREMALVSRLHAGFEVKAAGFADALLPVGLAAQPAASDGDRPAPAGTDRPGAPRRPGESASSPRLSAEALAGDLRADGRETRLGQAIRAALDRERGRPLGAMIVFTDGIHNGGPDPREAADRAREAGVALHVVALGTTAPRDLQIVQISAPEVAFVRDEVPVTVRVHARGMAGQTVPVTLTVDGLRADAHDLVLTAEGEATVPLKFTPEHTGDFTLEVSTPARPDEILEENNRVTRRLRVVDDRIRVLLVEQSPRWEFRYLQALLMRDRRVDLKCVLIDGDPAISRAPGSPYLDAFPTLRENLFGFDLIIWGDVDPRHFTPSQLEFVADFVARSGGSFLMIAGRRFSPWTYRDTPIERLLPVDFERPLTGSPERVVSDRPRRLRLTPEGRTSPLLRLSEDPDENLRRWDALPPLFWVAPVGRAKPAAQVLVVEAAGAEADPAGGTEGLDSIPVMAMQQYGVGRSMFLGTDNTWRWRRNEGEAYFISFWGRVVQQLAIHHLLHGSRQTQITLDRNTAVPGERIAVSARLFTSAFEPLIEPAVPAQVVREDSGRNDGLGAQDLLLRAVPDRPGLYQGELIAPAPGRYRLQVGAEAPASVDLTVEERWVESGETAMQEGLLRDLASRTGGALFREEDVRDLPDVVRSQAQRVQSRLAIDLWSSPLYYLLILSVFTVEWALRKWWHLK